MSSAQVPDAPVRLRLDLGYGGADFSGWALQPDQRTVQGVVEAALSTLFRLERVRVTAAGRTDAGVHATGQVGHCDVPFAGWLEQKHKGIRRLAGLLPPDVRIHSMTVAPEGFDARFSAIWRSYRYRISDADFGVEASRRHNTVAWRRTLDTDAMQESAQRLLGLHDFAAFCRRRDGATSIRTLQHLDVLRDGHHVDVMVQADAFCHSMVRSMVGALTAVGEGNRAVEWLGSLLSRATRSDEITVAPAHGLTLIGVGYPLDSELAVRAAQTRAVRTPTRPNPAVPG